MRKLFQSIAAVVATVAAASCAKEIPNETPAGNLVPVTLEAEIVNTKAEVQTDGKVYWQEGDAIAVWANSAKYELTLTSGEGTASATFSGEIPDGAAITAAAYPASRASSTEGEVLPKTSQTIASGATCDPEAVVMTGAAPVEGKITFQNACGGLRITLPEGVTALDLYYSAEEPVSVSLPGEAGAFDIMLPVADYGQALVVATSASSVEGFLMSKGLNVKRSTIVRVSSPAFIPCSLIYDAETLQAYLDNPDKAGFVVKDIDLEGVTVTSCESFANVLDGLGHSICNWTATVPLFTSGTAACEVKNLTIDESSVLCPSGRFGAFFGITSGTLTNCANYASANVVNNAATQYQFGGLVGRLDGFMKDCSNYGSFTFEIANNEIETSDSPTMYIGGIVGNLTSPKTSVRLEGCANYGDLNFTIKESLSGTTSRIDNTYIGGIFGATGVNKPSGTETSGYAKNYGIVKDCTNTGDVVFNHPDGGTSIYAEVGGVAGYFEGHLEGCVNEGLVKYANSMTVANAKPSVGGIAGALAFTAKDCTNKGEVRIEGMFSNGSSATAAAALGSTYASCGGCFGVVGIDATTIDNCDNEGDVITNTTMASTANSSCAYGGIAGICPSKVVMSNCDVNADLSFTGTSKTCFFGGITGYSKGTVTECTRTGAMNVSSDISYLGSPIDALLNCGGIVGYNYLKVQDCTVEEGSSLTVNACAEGRIGGIIGMHGSGTTDVTGNENYADITYTKCADIATATYCAGVIGCVNTTCNVEDCTNNGDIKVTASQTSGAMYIGGISGRNSGTDQTTEYFRRCGNTGDITVDGNGMKKQVYLGGCFGACYIASGKKLPTHFEDSTNSGNVELKNVDCPGSYVYVGGVQGGYSTAAPYIDNCTNSGNVTSTCASKMRVGGVSGAGNGTLTGNTNTGTVTMKNATASSQAGLIGGYSSCTDISGSVCKGTLVVENNTSSAMGLVLGQNGETAARTYHSLTVDAQATAGEGQAVGYFIGVNADSSSTTGHKVGKDGSPVTFKPTCAINGVTIPANPTASDLAASQGTKPLQIVNVVVE